MRLEVIATTLEDGLEAEAGGADRLEVVRDLDRGGLTPPVAIVEALLARVRLPLRVMVRVEEPFVPTSPAVVAQMCEEARALASLPIDGLVFGTVTDAHEIDLDALRRFADAVVALDDGSTDGTAALLAQDPLVRVLLRNPLRETYAGWDDAANRNRLLEGSIKGMVAELGRMCHRRGDLVEERLHPGDLDRIDRDAVDARGALCWRARRTTPATSRRCGRPCQTRRGIDASDPAWHCDTARAEGLERGPGQRPDRWN